VKNVKKVMRQQTRFMLTAALTVIGVLAVTGCTNSGNGGAAQLLKQFPWLAPLGLSFVSGCYSSTDLIWQACSSRRPLH
jgi:hypothetical protein